MHRQNIAILLLTMLFVFTDVGAQEIRGYIIDSETEKPIEYANVIIEGSNVGTISDESGFFILELPEKASFLLVSFIGYSQQRIRITASTQYKIYMEPDAEVLDEVVVVGDNTRENPAHYILRRIRQNHRKYSIKQGSTFEYRKYDKVRFDLYDSDSSLKHLGPFKGFDELRERKYFKNDRSYVPLLLIEEINKVYGKTMPDRKKELLEASNTSGFKNNVSVTTYLKELYLEYDVFANYILLFNKKFVSPLSARARNSYKYAIVDSSFYDGNRIYQIQFFPRRKRELTFEGTFWADTTKYMLRSIDLKASEGFNVNFVNSIEINQQFKRVNENLIVLEKDSLVMDFSPFKQFQFLGAEGAKVTTYYDHKLNVMIPFSFASNLTVTNDEPYLKTSDDWKKIRPVGLQANDRDIYNMHENLAKDPKFIFYRKLGEMISSGWYNYGVIDYGPYYNLIGYNQIEGFRLQLGARTYFSMNDRWRLGGYAAYGTRDKDFKYGLGFSYLLTQKNRWIVSLGVKDDIEQRGVLLSQDNNVYSRNFAASIFTMGDNSKLTNTRTFSAGIEMEAIENLKIKLTGKYDHMTSISGFNMGYLDPVSQEVKNELKDFQIGLSLVYSPNRKEIGYGVDRDFVTYWHPKFRVQYIRGVAGLIESGFAYDKVKVYARYPFLTTFFGKSVIVAEAGKTFGTVPLQLMDIIPGNQTITVAENMFSLMDYYEFLSDTYTTIHLDHHFNGRIMSKIPLFNRFDLRSVAGARFAWGIIQNKENIEINRSEVLYRSPDKGYVEFSAGVENIFKMLRVEAVWRQSYLENPNASPFGVRFLLKFVF